MIYFWAVSVEDDFGLVDAFLAIFCWSIPWIHLYKLRRTHKRAVVAVVVAVAVAVAAVTTATTATTATTTAATANTTATTGRLCLRLRL